MPNLPASYDPWIQLVSLISSALVAVAAGFGIFRLWEWRRELVGRAKFELARKIVLIALQFKDEFHYSRRIFTLGGEATGRKKAETESGAESRVLDEYYARTQRLQALQETLRRLHEARWEADIVLSEEDAKLVQPLEDAFSNLSSSVHSLFQEQLRHAKRPGGPGAMSESQDRELHEAVYGTVDDKMGKQVDQAVSTLKARLKRYLH